MACRAHMSKIMALMRLRPYDTSTQQGRASERQRRAALTTLTSAASKLTAALTVLVSIPATLHYLGPERFGIWMTISSLVVLFSFADLGVGNAILNAVAAANGREDQGAMRRHISSGFFVLTLVGAAVILFFAVGNQLIPWSVVFNVSSESAQSELGTSMFLFAICFALSLPAGIVQRTQLALQEGFLTNVWQAIGSLLGLGAVLAAIHIEAGLPWLVAAFLGAPLLAALLNSVIYFVYRRPELRPHWRHISKTTTLRIMRVGLLFLILQITSAIAVSTDNVIVAHVLGAQSVSTYAVPAKMFGLVSVLTSMLLMPLWPAYGEALARGDSEWVRKTLSRSILLAVLLAGGISLAFVAGGQKILELWVGSAVSPPFILLLGFGIWTVLEAGGNALAMFLNGANIIRVQVVVAIAFATSSLLLKVLLIGTMGTAGVIWATVFAYVGTVVIPLTVLLRRVWPKMPGTQQNSAAQEIMEGR